MTSPAKTGSPAVAMLGNLDLSAVLRGRSFPARRTEEALAGGLPWVPANILLSPFDSLPAGSPFGPLGETRLRDAGVRPMVLPAREDRPPLAFHLANITTTEDTPWEACPRGQLERAVAVLRERHGLIAKVGIEHECYLLDLQPEPTPAFSLAGSRAVSGLALEVQDTLDTAGFALDQFVAEFGARQFEISSPPLDPLGAADLAVLSREAIRDAARARGAHATFAPKPFADAPGSGVHVHLSLWREDGTPLTARNGGPSETSGAFVAGVLARIDAVLAFATASVNGFERIRPSHWVGAFGCFGTRNREAAIRLCPRSPGKDDTYPAASLEYRVADASANPYLTLAALLHAGLHGLDATLTTPEDVQLDPATLSSEERRVRGIGELPVSFEACLASLERSGTARAWFGRGFEDAFLAVRRNDLVDAERAGEHYRERFVRAV